MLVLRLVKSLQQPALATNFFHNTQAHWLEIFWSILRKSPIDIWEINPSKHPKKLYIESYFQCSKSFNPII